MFKPSLIVTNNVPLTAKKLDVYNFLLQEAFDQLEENYEKNIFLIKLSDVEKIAPMLDTTKKVAEFFKEIMDIPFKFNLIGKDKSVEARVTSHLISGFKENTNRTFEVALEPFTIEAFRKMIKRQIGMKEVEERIEDGIIIKETKEIELQPYMKAKITDHLDITFYPAKVVYEIIKDYKNALIPKILFTDFKIITQTEDKYKNQYNSMVIKKIEEILNEKEKDLDLKIQIEKSGRINKWVIITSNWNRIPESFDEYLEKFLEAGKMAKTEKNINMAKRFYKERK